MLLRLALLISLLAIGEVSSNLNPIAIGLRSAFSRPSTSFVGKRSHSTPKSHNPYFDLEALDSISDFPDDELQNVNIQQNEQNSSIVRNVSNTGKVTKKPETKLSRGGGTTPALSFHENMICGAVSRSIAQVCTHPANTMKTLLQSNRGTGASISIKTLARPSNLKMLTRGAGAQFVLSIPHGAVNFAVLEFVRRKMNNMVMKTTWGADLSEKSPAFGPALDFMSSAVATICCSVVSTPQMMIVDNIMAGTYSNLPNAIVGLSRDRGILGFYGGWWPGLVGKIPSYALTWTLFQQLKLAQLRIMERPPKDIENSIMGCMASTTTVCIMIPVDTIKTRLVTQMNYPDLVPYKGIIDCAKRIAKEEGIKTFYRGLPPRLISVVPMIGIQFGVYEAMKKVMVSRRPGTIEMKESHVMEEIMMEVSADDEQPFPSPLFEERETDGKKKKKRRTARTLKK
ncbi:hypothetical protein CTEN210_13844 [Chaetoceros tenuissimus]|uniref:Mitochondrial carrier protein n=1 Tax=Chaetoceros tenuissimus TaxID=426638 RepID=A0AAD3D413_9STRA|nr:hypothetical protein CTEN210_13844 [Chaetoceros tenuissimus]